MKTCRRLLLLAIICMPLLSACGSSSNDASLKPATFDNSTFDNSTWN